MSPSPSPPLHPLKQPRSPLAQRDALGRSAVEFAEVLAKPNLISLMKRLPVQLFTAPIAAACRFGVYNYYRAVRRTRALHPSDDSRAHSHAALARLMSPDRRAMSRGSHFRFVDLYNNCVCNAWHQSIGVVSAGWHCRLQAVLFSLVRSCCSARISFANVRDVFSETCQLL